MKLWHLESQGELWELARWLMLTPGVFVILLGCGQFALWGKISGAYVDMPSNLQADYHPWSFIALAPLNNSAIMDEIQREQETQNTPEPIKIPVSFWATPQPAAESSSDPAPTTDNPVPPTAAPLTTLQASFTVTPKRTASATFTASPTTTRTPTFTLTPTRTGTWLLTVTRTTTPTTTSTPTIVPTETPKPIPSATVNLPPLPPRPTSPPTEIPTQTPDGFPVPSETPMALTNTPMLPTETPTP